jgi:hypothetical protein
LLYWLSLFFPLPLSHWLQYAWKYRR